MGVSCSSSCCLIWSAPNRSQKISSKHLKESNEMCPRSKTHRCVIVFDSATAHERCSCSRVVVVDVAVGFDVAGEPRRPASERRRDGDLRGPARPPRRLPLRRRRHGHPPAPRRRLGKHPPPSHFQALIGGHRSNQKKVDLFITSSFT